MANKFTLDDINQAADKKYGHTEIEHSEGSVRLVNALRLKKAKRDELTSVQERMSEDDADQVEILENMLRTVADDEFGVETLIKDLDGDLGKLMATFEIYMGATELGEASASQD
jgi:hypothetical protein